MTYDGQGEAEGIVTREEAESLLDESKWSLLPRRLGSTIVALYDRIAALEKALRQIEAFGTKEESIRVGDAYDLERGYRDYITQTEEAKIAQAALKEAQGE